MDKISVIVPCYNEEKALPIFYEELNKVIEKDFEGINFELIFVDDANVKVVVHDDRKVVYNDDLTSLSAIAKSIKGYPCAGPSFFKYNGELVCDIAERTQWKNG